MNKESTFSKHCLELYATQRYPFSFCYNINHLKPNLSGNFKKNYSQASIKKEILRNNFYKETNATAPYITYLSR